DRQGRAPELPEVVEKWQGERDRRGTEQEVDELRALEIGPVGSAGRPEDDGQDHNRHENGVDVGLAPRGAKTSIPRRIGEKRQREPEEGPFGEVAPERGEVRHRPPLRDGRRGRRPPRLPRWQGRWTRRARQAVRPPGCRVWRYGRRPPPRPERREVRGWRGYPRPSAAPGRRSRAGRRGGRASGASRSPVRARRAREAGPPPLRRADRQGGRVDCGSSAALRKAGPELRRRGARRQPAP